MATEHLSCESQLTRVTVAEAMRTGVIGCTRESSLPKLAAALVDHGIHAVLVPGLDAGPPLVVTDMDIVRAATQLNDAATAADIARDPIASVSSDSTLDEAVEKMAIHYVTHLLATEPGSGAPLGILSSLDIAAVAGGSLPRLARMRRPAPARPAPSADALARARVSEVMHPGVISCDPDAPLETVARMMADHRVHCVAVAGIDHTEDRGAHLTWGLVTDLDLVTALHRATMLTSAALAAETEPVAVAENETLARAAELMVEHDAAHLVVVSPVGLPSGIVSTLDIALILAAHE